MCAGADCIDDADLVRSGGMTALPGGVYAPSTIGTLLREFTFGHARQLESVLREHLAGLGERVDVLPGAEVRAFVIDSLLVGTDRGRQRGQALAQHLAAADLRVPVGGALFGVPAHRARR